MLDAGRRKNGTADEAARGRQVTISMLVIGITGLDIVMTETQDRPRLCSDRSICAKRTRATKFELK